MIGGVIVRSMVEQWREIGRSGVRIARAAKIPVDSRFGENNSRLSQKNSRFLYRKIRRKAPQAIDIAVI